MDAQIAVGRNLVIFAIKASNMINIPNALTIFRIVAIPLIIIVYMWRFPAYEWVCTILFTFAGISDALDGYLARKWNQTSKLGAFLDPVADKLLVSTLLILVASDERVLQTVQYKNLFVIAVMIIIGREITVSALREWMAELGNRAAVAVSTVGKYKTGFQMTAIGALLLFHNLLFLPTMIIGEICLYLAAILTVWSMAIYLRAAYNTVEL